MKLYIIGNGFDLHHNMPTGYNDYKKFLNDLHPDTIKSFESFGYIKGYSKEDILWTNLENALTLDSEYLISDFINDYYPDPSSDSDYTFDEMRVELENETQFIYNFTGLYFFEWIESINSSGYNVDKNLHFDSNDLFITFNYTDTLESLYQIPSENILHIHGKINDELSSKILGGNSYHPAKTIEEAEIFDSIPIPPINNHSVHSEIQFGSTLNDPKVIEEKLQNKYSDDDFYGASIRQGVNEIVKYCNASYKDLTANYPILKGFIADKPIAEVIIMGHSFDGIDEPYYSDILVPIFKDIKWTFYIHGNTNKYLCFVDKYGITNHSFVSW